MAGKRMNGDGNAGIFRPPRRNFPQPQWDGGPLEGHTLLLHTEQGFGDAIQFIRYVPLVVQRGGKIIIECQAESPTAIADHARGMPNRGSR